MAKEINFDLDGTLVRLYEVENWLDYLLNSDITPYEIAKPLIRMASLAKILNRLQKEGYSLKIISWLAKDSTKEYNERVAETKKLWLKKHLPSVCWNEICITEYGTPKSEYGKGILFDDEEKNREEWEEKGGIAYDINNIIEELKKIK